MKTDSSCKNIMQVEETSNHIPNAETRAAIQEVQDMISGKIKGKEYSTFDELLRDLED